MGVGCGQGLYAVEPIGKPLAQLLDAAQAATQGQQHLQGQTQKAQLVGSTTGKLTGPAVVRPSSSLAEA